jgi:hypothetical protein
MNHNNPKSLRIAYSLATKWLQVVIKKFVMHSILSGAIFK